MLSFWLYWHITIVLMLLVLPWGTLVCVSWYVLNVKPYVKPISFWLNISFAAKTWFCIWPSCLCYHAYTLKMNGRSLTCFILLCLFLFYRWCSKHQSSHIHLWLAIRNIQSDLRSPTDFSQHLAILHRVCFWAWTCNFLSPAVPSLAVWPTVRGLPP